MKRILLIISLIHLMFLMIACSGNNQNPLMIKDTNANTEIIEEDDIEFEIEQIILSKSFQSLEPKVEIVKRDKGFRLLASLGLLETSGVKITNINKIEDEINIYVKNITDIDENRLAIPQVIIELKNIKLRSIENAVFNIINENYNPIKVKLSANEVINKVNSDFQIVTNTSPEVNIINTNDSFYWILDYKNILDKYNLETPIVNMSVMVDANSGELVKSSKSFISQYIDEGNILDYIPNEYILYGKEDKTLSSEGKWINLIAYNVNDNTKRILYSTSSEIIDAQYSPSYDSITILESNFGVNQLYIINKGENKAYKVMLDAPINPSIVRWKDNENLYILGKTDITSAIYNYNIVDNTVELINYMYADIVGIQVQNNDVLVTIKDKKSDKYSIKLTSDLINFEIEKEGYMPRFINENYIGYLVFNEKNNTNNLVLLNRENKKIHNTIDLNVSNYYGLDDNSIIVISKNQINNDFTLLRYYFKNKNIESIINITSDKAFYDSKNELLYIDFKIPYESDKSKVIFSLNLDKFKIAELSIKE